MSGEISYIVRDEFEAFIKGGNWIRQYTPSEFRSKLIEFKKTLKIEIEKNIFSPIFHNEFLVLNFINNNISKLMQIHIGDTLFVNHVYFLLRFKDDYNNIYDDLKTGSCIFECISSDNKSLTDENKCLRVCYYISCLNFIIYELITFLLIQKNIYKDNISIKFEFESELELKTILNLKQIFEFVCKLTLVITPFQINNSILKNPPYYYYQLMTYFENNYKMELKHLIDDNKDNVKIQSILKGFIYDIENSHFTKNNILKEKYYSKEELMFSDIVELLKTEKPMDEAKKSGNPDLAILTMNKEDFDIFFKDQNIDLRVYDRKREEYSNLFKYEIVSDFYKLIQSYIQTDNTEVNSIDESKKEDISHIPKSTMPPPQKPTIKKYEIFEEARFYVFEICYNEFKDSDQPFTKFSCVFDILKEKEFKVIPETLGQKKFRNFLKEYSNNVLDFKPFKSPNENKKSLSYNSVKKFLNPYKIPKTTNLIL